MNVLHISSEPPGNKSGGQIVIKQSLYSLSRVSNLDYLGVTIKENIIKDRYSNVYYLKEDNKLLTKIIECLLMKKSKVYFDFRKKIENVDIKKYDYVYLEFTKWLFAIKYAKKNNKKVIVRLHNIESDLIYNLYKIEKSPLIYISYLYYKYIEKRIISKSDYIIALTEKDKKRIFELYGNVIKKDHIYVMPVCVEKRGTNKNIMNKNEIKLLITGSLYYGPNYEGVIWFINNVWRRIKDNCKLFIVGSNPNSKLKNLVKYDNKIELISNPKDTKDYFMNSDIFVSPIFSGAGMKVKNAEAMSYGLPIVGTDHSFIGYEKSIKYHFIANNADDFVDKIKYLMNQDIDEMNRIKKDVLLDFEKRYNIDNSYQYIEKILK